MLFVSGSGEVACMNEDITSRNSDGPVVSVRIGNQAEGGHDKQELSGDIPENGTGRSSPFSQDVPLLSRNFYQLTPAPPSAA